MLLLIFAASSLADDFEMGILRNMYGGCIGRVAVNELLSALLLCGKNVHI